MIKVLKKYQVQMSPFQATKDWALNNTDNENLLLYESTGSDDGLPIALEFIDYDSGIGLPFTNSNCNVALETQDADRAVFREGQKITGPFYPDQDPTNLDGTYKRSIYYQIKSSFYNDYRDFTKILGVETLDFELSKTKRRLEDNIKMFDIPRLVFGDKIIPNTLEMPNETLDNNFIISDDGYGNLYAGTNLFSKQQEIGNFSNEFLTGSDVNCSNYFILNPPPTPIGLTASINRPLAHRAVLTWQTSSGSPQEDGFIMERSDNFIPFVIIGIVGQGVLTMNDDTVQSNHTYSYRVYAYTTFERSGYSNIATVIGPAPPIFIVQPQDVYADIGGPADFNATTLCLYPEVTYSWQVNYGTNVWNSDTDYWDYTGSRFGPTYWSQSVIDSMFDNWITLVDDSRITGSNSISFVTGSDSTYLTINNLVYDDFLEYRAIATNWVGEATSSIAHIYLRPPEPPEVSDPADISIDLTPGLPIITIQPVNQFTTIGGTASFFVNASGSEPLFYYWTFGFGNTFVLDSTYITGSDSASLIINNVQVSDSGSYRAFVANDNGYVYSNQAGLIL